MSTEADLLHMARAFELAQTQHGRTGENPSVGCVLVSTDGQVISEAATGDGGRPHAEETALEGLDGAAGGTAYVTLEPCRERSHGGAACSSRLIEAGVARVVCAIADAHPKGAGGFDRLRDAGIAVETGLMEEVAAGLYAEFFAGA